MKILQLEFHNSNYPSLFLSTDQTLVFKACKELGISVPFPIVDRGVIVFEEILLTELIESEESFESLDTTTKNTQLLLNGFPEIENKYEDDKKLILKRDNIFWQILTSPFNFLKHSLLNFWTWMRFSQIPLITINEESVDAITICEVKASSTPAIVEQQPEYINDVTLLPENQDYPGFILVVIGAYSSIQRTQIQFHCQNYAVAITNQTPFSYKDAFKRSILGNLIVIHADESEPFEMTYYSSSFDTHKKEEFFVSKGTVKITPSSFESNTEFEFECDCIQKIDANREFLAYLLKKQESNLQNVFEILSDQELKKEYLELFLLKKKTDQYMNLNYQPTNVI
ncbi:MAG: hypothetical protein ACRCXZ_08090 [Patescibacteria group bacterium]